MIDEHILRGVREEEQALLRRCHAFILGGPDTPGGGPEDVVYLTPCGRWLRVCSAGLIEWWPDPGPEAALWLNSRAAAEVFDDYFHPRVPELERYTAWDHAVNKYILAGLYQDDYGHVREDIEELRRLESLGDDITVQEGYRKSMISWWITSKQALHVRHPAPTLEEFCKDYAVAEPHCEELPPCRAAKLVRALAPVARGSRGALEALPGTHPAHPPGPGASTDDSKDVRLHEGARV